jgi:hypothetical protein
MHILCPHCRNPIEVVNLSGRESSRPPVTQPGSLSLCVIVSGW